MKAILRLLVITIAFGYTSCGPSVHLNKTDNSKEALAYLREKEPQVNIAYVQIHHYYSLSQLPLASLHAKVSAWHQPVYLDTFTYLSLMSSKLAHQLLNYCNESHIHMDTVSISALINTKPLSFVYDADVLYPVAALKNNTTAFVSALLESNRVKLDEYFAPMPNDVFANKNALIDSLMILGNNIIKKGSLPKIAYIGFTFPNADNQAQYQFTYNLHTNKEGDGVLVHVYIDSFRQKVYAVEAVFPEPNQ